MTSWTVFHQDPLSMGFPRQEYKSEFPFPCPGDVLHPGIGPETTALQGDFSGCNYRLRIPKKTRSRCCHLVTKSCLTGACLTGIPWTLAHQAPLSMGILQARILEWVAISISQLDLPSPGAEPMSPALQVAFLPNDPQL